MKKTKVGSRAVTLSLVFVLFACSGGGGTAAPAPPAPAPAPVAGKERTCPDAWYLNAMPGVIPAPGSPPSNSPPREYLVVGGQRRELAEFDLDWIRANCPVNKPETVH